MISLTLCVVLPCAVCKYRYVFAIVQDISGNIMIKMKNPFDIVF